MRPAPDTNPSDVVAPPCCKDNEELESLSGKRVAVIGEYRGTTVARRPGPIDLSEPGNAQLVLPSGILLMLGIYYEPSGIRSAEELQQHHGKKVKVIGVLHDHTPTRSTGGLEPMQTMIGPYVEVETLELK